MEGKGDLIRRHGETMKRLKRAVAFIHTLVATIFKHVSPRHCASHWIWSGLWLTKFILKAVQMTQAAKVVGFAIIQVTSTKLRQ